MKHNTLGLTAALVSALVITACSDPVAPMAEVDDPRMASGHVTIASVKTSFASGAGNTVFCGQSAANVFNSASTCEMADPFALVTTLNPGWAAYTPSGDFPAAVWIGPVANSDAYVNLPGTYTYQKTFEIPAGTQNFALNMQVLADNNMSVYVNNVLIGQQNQLDNFFTTPVDFNATTELQVGTNTIRFVVNNTRVDGVANDVACAPRPAQYAIGDYDAVECKNPTGFLYSAVVGWDLIPPPQVGYWCSPGYWKNAKEAAWVHVGGLAIRNTLYNSVISSPSVSGNPTIWTVLQNPSTYKGPATNAVANYLAGLAGWSGTQDSNIGCPLNNHGALVGVSQ